MAKWRDHQGPLDVPKAISLRDQAGNIKRKLMLFCVKPTL